MTKDQKAAAKKFKKLLTSMPRLSVHDLKAALGSEIHGIVACGTECGPARRMKGRMILDIQFGAPAPASKARKR